MKGNTAKTNDVNGFEREFDFYLTENENIYKCEVKLMGRRNPESADVVIARDSNAFIADKLSETSKSQLNRLKAEWVELRSENGYKRLGNVLKNLQIPHKNFMGDVDEQLDDILNAIQTIGQCFKKLANSA